MCFYDKWWASSVWYRDQRLRSKAFFRSRNTTPDTPDLLMAVRQEFEMRADAVLQENLRLNPDKKKKKKGGGGGKSWHFCE